MATSLEKGESAPTCSICVDVFQDPVTLPCQHDFCRPCLQMFAEKTKPKTEADDSVDVKDTDQEVTVTVTCPVCRSPADLGSTGVAGLPTNTSLADLLRKFQAEDNTCGQDIPKCSLCEDDNSPAVKRCQTCNLLYCQDCFTVCHPMRGAMKRHDVIPVENFLCLSAAGKSGTTVNSKASAGDPGDPARPIPCDKHSQPLCIFCVTCKEVICVECLEEHTDHTTRSIKSACQMLKTPLLEKTGEYTKLKDQIAKLQTEMKGLYHDIQGNEDAHSGDIERAYKAATEALNCWRRDALKVVEKRHSNWRHEWKAAMKDLDMKAEEVNSMIATSKDLISSLEVIFLKGSKQLKASLDEQLPGIMTSVKKQEQIKTKMRESVRLDPVIPRRLLVKESILSRPELKFIETNKINLKLCDGRSMVEYKYITPLGYVKPSLPPYEAWAGGFLPPGESYWEMEVTIQADSDGGDYKCKVGVKHQGSYLSNGWWMGFNYKADNFRCGSSCGEVKPVYQQWRPHTGSHRLGFYLNTDKRTLIIVDCVQNQVMFTSKPIDVSKPLVAAVDFMPVKSASARLKTGHNCIPSRAIVGILC